MPFVLPDSFFLKNLLSLGMLFWLIAWPGLTQGQNSYKNKFIKVAALEGLKVNCILQDQQGFMWFGTETGLYRYDGYSTELINNTSAGMQLSSDLVLALYEDREGNLWIGTDKGVNKLSADRKFIKTYLTSPNFKNSSKSIIKSITQTHNNTIWYISEDGNLYRTVGKADFSLVANVLLNRNLTAIMQLREDKKHYLWVAFPQGFIKLDASGNEIQHFPIPANQRTIAGAIAEDKPFFADLQHLYTFSVPENKFYPILSEELSSLLKDEIRYVYQDKKGYQWLVTNNRLVRFNPKTKQIHDFTAAFTSVGASRFNIDCLYETNSGQLWIGSYFGVYRFDNRESVFATISPPQRLGNQSYFATRGITELPKGNLFIGSYKGFFEYNTASQKFTEHKIRTKDYKEVNPLVRALISEPDGNLWLATEGNGLLYFNTKTHRFTAYLDSLNPAAKVAPKGINATFNYSLLKDAQG